MPIIDAERVNSFLSAPVWSEGQWQECERLCEDLEGELGDRLGTQVTPVPWSETAAITHSGLLATSHPVVSVSVLDGTTIAEGAPLPTGWTLQGNRLRLNPLLGYPGYSPSFGGFGGPADRVQGYGSVTLSYMAGWGDKPGLRKALVSKIAAIMDSRHDDSMIITEDGRTTARAPLKEEWSDDEIAALGIYRNLVVWR